MNSIPILKGKHAVVDPHRPYQPFHLLTTIQRFLQAANGGKRRKTSRRVARPSVSWNRITRVDALIMRLHCSIM